MEEMLKTIVKYVVDNPDSIEVTKRQEDKTAILELKVAQEDMGKVIGKQGKMAKAIRTLMKAYGAKIGEKINVDIID